MRKFKISVITAVLIFPFFNGLRAFETAPKNNCMFPEITFSNSAEFESTEKIDERIEVCEKNDGVVVKFKLIEWLKSVFRD